MRHFIFPQYSVWKCNIYHLSSLTFRPRWPFFGHLHPSATSSEQDRITQHHISAQIMQPKQKQKFKRWKEIFLTSWKISTNPSIGCVWKIKKAKGCRMNVRHMDFIVGYFFIFWEGVSLNGREGEGVKWLQKLLTSRWRQHNIWAAPPLQPLSSLHIDRCFILQLRKIKTVNMSVNTLLLITDE